MATEHTIDGSPPPAQVVLGAEISATTTTTTTTTMTETPPPHPEVPAYVAVIIGRNAPTRRSILITPPKHPSLDQPPSSQPSSSISQPSPRTSSSTTSSPVHPTSTDGGENASPDTTRPSSFESFKGDTACDSSQETCSQPPEQGEGEDALMDQRLNVKFAPLPDVGPRKRRGVPLGVAARSRMVRRKRSRSMEGGVPPSHAVSSMWTEEEIEEQRARLAKAWEKEREKRDYYHDVDENGDPVEDPITAFGRLVKVAGKQLWNKMASREAKENSRPAKEGKGKATRKGGLSKKHQAQHHTRSSSAPPDSDRNCPSTSEQQQLGGNEETHDDTKVDSSEEVETPQEREENDPTITRKKVFPWSRARITLKPGKGKDPSPVLRSKSFTGTPSATTASKRSSKRSESIDVDNEAQAPQGEDKQGSTTELRRSMSI